MLASEDDKRKSKSDREERSEEEDIVKSLETKQYIYKMICQRMIQTTS